MPEQSPSYESEDILAQVYMAFGQGAGTMYATSAALRAGRDEYVNAIRPEDWDRDAPLALEYARALGRVAAHVALQEGATAIDEPHYRKASELVRGHQIGPFFCPYCPPVLNGRPGRPPDRGPLRGGAGPKAGPIR